jgi:predicted N-acetyltransferase YhbS
VRIRSEEPNDLDAIRRVHVASFPTANEAKLVEALRASGRVRYAPEFALLDEQGAV